MFLPRRRGWIFSLLSSQSTSPPSAIVRQGAIWLQDTDITMCYLQSNLYSHCYFSYCNRPLYRKHIMTNKSIKDLLFGCILNTRVDRSNKLAY